jgi:hypothetical protein
MNSRFIHLFIVLVAAFGIATNVHAEIEVLLSVKFILHPNGTRPSAAAGPISISNVVDFNAEVIHGNRALAHAARGFKLRVVEYLDVRPSAPPGQPVDYWFNLDARQQRQAIETAAVADTTTTTWLWNANALNIYINNSSSGSCSFVGSGLSIALGATVFTAGTVIHEVGHFFNLSHTHSGDAVCPASTAPPLAFMPLADGDLLPSTIPDHNCLRQRDWLSQSNFNGRLFAALTPAEQAQVNTSWRNVMSYHVEEEFVADQMDIWTTNSNHLRLFACVGRTWIVASDGSDAASGTNFITPFATITRALASVALPRDVVLLRSGTYNAPGGGLFSKPVTYSATRGPVTIVRP